eukprot:gene2157-biopygen1930
MSIRTISEKYMQLDKLKQDYTNRITTEINTHELDKHSEFMKSKLNIKLEKFSGLKEAFGNTRIMLSRKLQQTKSFDFIKRDPEKLIAALSKVISLMKEVSALAEKHHIEEYLYYGDSIAKKVSKKMCFKDCKHDSNNSVIGVSLNDILAKGTNDLNKLHEIFLRWTTQPVAIATDIKKMYSTIKLEEEHWTHQGYLWQSNLEVGQEPEEKVINTLIYGIRSSGNQAEYALHKVAEMSKDEFPKVNDIIHNEVYVDDCLTGEVSHHEAHSRSDELEVVLNCGCFQIKVVAFSGEEPPSSPSEDGETIFVAGMKWFVKSDMLSLNIGDLNFAKKQRGKKPSHLLNVIPSKLTHRHCASKVAEVFGLSGTVSPLIASMKIDLQELIHQQLDWDDAIPDSLRPISASNFKLLKDIGQLKFKRVIIPEDAVSLHINTIDFGDASHLLTCIAIYARFLRRNGKYSCQLIFPRTRTVPKDHTQPRAELYAALINSHTGEVVNIKVHDQSSFPIKSAQELRLDISEMQEVQKEIHLQVHHTELSFPSKRKSSMSKNLTDDEISDAENYYFKKATEEVCHFMHPKKYEPITTLKNGILMYNGRILPSNKVSIVGRYTDAMLDLRSSTFCVPVIAMFINVMDDYSSTAFIQSFTRFATRYGFPSKVFFDKESQLVKGAKDMRLNFNDIRSRLHKERKVYMQTCPLGAHNMNGNVEL